MIISRNKNNSRTSTLSPKLSLAPIPKSPNSTPKLSLTTTPKPQHPTPKPPNPNSHSAFTIVELLIVIVVIGILAAITIVAYNGIQTRARQSSLKSDLATAASQLGQLNATDGRYPSSISSLKKSDTTHYDYTYEEATNSYCITATHTQTDVGAFHRINGGPIQEGACTGHEGSAPGVGGGGTETYAVGDTGPAGGFIFIVDEDDEYPFDYMELATTAVAVSPFAEWGCYGIDIPAANNTAIGTGKSNTAAILEACSTPNIPARLADNYSFGGYDDWFLPSVDEFNAFRNLVFQYNSLYPEIWTLINVSHDGATSTNISSTHGAYAPGFAGPGPAGTPVAKNYKTFRAVLAIRQF